MNHFNYHAKLSSKPGSDLMFGRYRPEIKEKGETHEQHEQRTWREKVSRTPEGVCYLQPFALKNAFESAGKWLGMKIPGEGKKTFTDRFRKAVLVVDRMLLTNNGKPVMIDDVEPRSLHVPSDGRRGSAKRVVRIFPTITQWETEIAIHVLDGKIDKDVLLDHLECCGDFIGFGSMRVENGGINGRFAVDSLELVGN